MIGGQNEGNIGGQTRERPGTQQKGPTGSTKFEFGKYSTFEDIPRSLVVTGDKDSGTIVLWNQDSYISHKSDGEQG